MRATLAFLAVPPINLLLLCIAGFAAEGLGRRRVGRWLMAVGGAGLLLLALPGVSSLLIVSLESGLATTSQSGLATTSQSGLAATSQSGLAAASQSGDAAGDPPGAIVILGGDISLDASLPPDPGLGPLSLERLRAGAALARRTGSDGRLLPILVTGGVLTDGHPPIAALMAASLAADFGVPARWQETRAADTWENARDSAVILKAAGIGSVYLVTHAWHMRRALMAFRHFGIVAIPAPVRRDVAPHLDAGDFVPRASAWLASYYALHEWIGCAVYALRG